MPRKPIIPMIHEPVEHIRYIGDFLGRKLREEGIRTVADLIDALEDQGHEWENPIAVRHRVRDWIRGILENPRGNGCCYPQSKVINGEECAYLARETNFRGHNAIVDVWRAYADQPYYQWIPRKFRGRNERNKYPRQCRLDL